MNSFYSLIKIAPNSLSDENLTIGIIVSAIEGGMKVKFSKNKIGISKSIISSEAKIVDFICTEINKKVNEINTLEKKSTNQLFEKEQLLSFNFFDYLTKYSNGILRFSTPQFISNRVSDADFIKLYRLFVDDKIDETKINKKSDEVFYKRIKSNLIDRVKNQVHTNYKIDSKLVPTISTPNFEIDCIGLNGTLIGAKSLPFSTSREALSKNVNTYISIIAHLSKLEKKNLNDIDFYLIADRPENNKSDVFKYWEQINKSESIFRLIPSTDVEIIADKIEKKNAQKFLEFV